MVHIREPHLCEQPGTNDRGIGLMQERTETSGSHARRARLDNRGLSAHDHGSTRGVEHGPGPCRALEDRALMRKPFGVPTGRGRERGSCLHHHARMIE